MTISSDTIHGRWADVEFKVDAAMSEQGGARVTAVRIDGRAVIHEPLEIPRGATLGEALDAGVYYAIRQIEPEDTRPFAPEFHGTAAKIGVRATLPLLRVAQSRRWNGWLPPARPSDCRDSAICGID